MGSFFYHDGLYFVQWKLWLPINWHRLLFYLFKLADSGSMQTDPSSTLTRILTPTRRITSARLARPKSAPSAPTSFDGGVYIKPTALVVYIEQHYNSSTIDSSFVCSCLSVRYTDNTPIHTTNESTNDTYYTSYCKDQPCMPVSDKRSPSSWQAVTTENSRYVGSLLSCHRASLLNNISSGVGYNRFVRITSCALTVDGSLRALGRQLTMVVVVAYRTTATWKEAFLIRC